jgi:hypothetical protein
MMINDKTISSTAARVLRILNLLSSVNMYLRMITYKVYDPRNAGRNVCNSLNRITPNNKMKSRREYLSYCIVRDLLLEHI